MAEKMREHERENYAGTITKGGKKDKDPPAWMVVLFVVIAIVAGIYGGKQKMTENNTENNSPTLRDQIVLLSLSSLLFHVIQIIQIILGHRLILFSV